MAFNKRAWKGRQGTGLNKFSINGATPVTVVNQPDSITEVGDALSAGNLNDLEDRIESAFTDEATEREADITDVKNAISALDHRLENIEQSKGDYIVASYKDGSITPSGKGKWCVVEGVEGVSRVENNLVQNGDFANGTTGWAGSGMVSFTASDGVATFTANAQNAQIENTHGITLNNTHFYLFSLKAKGSSSNSGLFAIVSGAGSGSVALNSLSVTTSWRTFAGVFKPVNNSTTAKVDIYDGRSSSWDAYQVKDVFFTDLNIYFGTSDLSFLGATDSAKLATIQRDYPHLLLPSDYGTRIVDWTGNGVRAWGVNLIDASNLIADSYVDSLTGIIGVYSGVKRTDYMRVKGGESYFFGGYIMANKGNTGAYFDINKNFLGAIPNDSDARPFVAPANCAYVVMNFWLTNWGDLATTAYFVPYDLPHVWSPYMESTLSFPSTSLKSAGSVYDSCEPNVEVGGVAKKRTTQRIEGVDLGTDVSFQYDSSANRFYSTSLSATIGGETVSGRYKNTMLGSGIYELSMTGADKTYFVYASNKILYIYDNSKTASDLVSGKAPWLVGIKLYYELADPVVTLSDPLIDNTLLTEAGGRMATVQTGTVVDGSFDMGFINL